MGGQRHVLKIAMIAVAALICAGAGTQAEPAKLTKDTVERFLRTVPEVQYIGVREGLDVSSKAKASENPFGAVVSAMSRKELRDEVQATISKHGFRSVKDWARTGQHIGQAYVHVTHGPVGSVAAAKMDENRERAIKEIEKLPFLSDKQKRKLIEQYDQTSEDLGREPPPENVAVVKEMRPQIEAVLKLKAN